LADCTEQGTLAKSGTSDFLARAEGQDTTGTGNLIGAFGLGFYSSFLVADRVHVASIPPKSEANSNPVQHVFSSSAEDASFEIYPDPRGNTLGRGTEITLHLKEDATEYLEDSVITNLVYVFCLNNNVAHVLISHSNKHSSYSSSFPIYLFTQKTVEVPDEDSSAPSASHSITPESTEATKAPVLTEVPEDEDQAIIEEVPSDEEKTPDEPIPPTMKSVVVDEWVQLNAQLPLWARFVLH
jgi:heat shock protein beta